ncbi:uncharacterized protein LACBIDRAFT_304787 [Laccaria bicolor S238N-H82]|uniref:Predicted protein n=1 Tax=Laccaria bicolor (strain S238N-H82 / ATCC MYA-4686) TaxID=486041 RepID=B0DMC0_LACBS|nr:uncharacterized protein LACBIDRAFT_304787 [Laccaria bicolor S238N-H82]EDR04255.1 predicted protein [Laccaria bicolor S238N-H82]|eukprot:XP_001885146.1 predicted protein [Laccaria bicolor S238N-H82]
MCRPKSPEGSNPEEDARVQDRQAAFLRKNNFRRIGRTRFFGYSPNPEHPSRLLPAEADADRSENEFVPTKPAPADRDDFMRTYPLHFAIINLPKQNVASVIEAYHTQDPSTVHKQDHNGFTPLYVAAAYANASALKALLKFGAASDLNKHVNKDGMIPLERIEDTMRSTRELAELLMHKWEGYSRNELKVQLILKREMGISVHGQTDEEYLENRKWGCTCGECDEGWLSPRMRFRLETEAALSKENMTVLAPQFQRGQPLPEIPGLAHQFDYLPPNLRTKVYKTFYNGYVTIFENLYVLLDQTEGVPSVPRLRTLCKGDRDVNFYLKKGGKFEYALESMVEGAKSQSCLGDSMFEEIWESENDTDDEYRKLPRCANDLEFDFVKRMIGVPPKGPVLPPEMLSSAVDSERGPTSLTLKMLVNMMSGVYEDEDSEDEEEEENYSDLLNPHYEEAAAGRRQARLDARRAAAAKAPEKRQAEASSAGPDLAFQKLLSFLPQGGVRAPIN